MAQYDRFRGSKCVGGWRSVTEVAKDVRKDIKVSIQDGTLPNLTYSVTCEKYSMGQSMTVEVRGVPERLQRLDEAKPLLDQLETLVSAYNWDGSDVQTDYFDVMFYAHIHYETAWARNYRLSRKAAA